MNKLPVVPTKMVLPAFAPGMLWLNATFKMMEMLRASSEVIGHRTRMMMTAGPLPGPADCAEFTLMGSEKVVAFADAAGRAARGWMALNQQWTSAWLGAAASPQAFNRNMKQAMALSSAAARLSSDVLHPVHGKATANARRLAASARKQVRRSAAG